jgi:hypothetical protein
VLCVRVDENTLLSLTKIGYQVFANVAAVFAVIIGIFIGGKGNLASSRFVWTTVNKTFLATTQCSQFKLTSNLLLFRYQISLAGVIVDLYF